MIKRVLCFSHPAYLSVRLKQFADMEIFSCRRIRPTQIPSQQLELF